jgi:hypothetical protein
MKRGLSRVLRVLFNAARGVMMAVAEKAKRHSKGSKSSADQAVVSGDVSKPGFAEQWDGVSWTKAERALVWFSVASMIVGVGIAGLAGLSLYGTMSVAHGQVISDVNGGANRPVITATQNQVPVVEIVRPNGAGL